MSKRFITLILFGLLLHQAEGQQRFELVNPSFETDKPNPNQTPTGWVNLGLEQYTPTDIQPGSFGVTIKAADGTSYVGMVVRDDNSWEGIGQKLNGWLKKDSSYSFSIWVARSNTYLSGTRTGKQANFTAPTILKVWGFNTKNQTEELLGESSTISHSKWVKYSFVLKPGLSDYDELDLMAYYAKGEENKNGNLLIDNCSAIEQIWPEDDRKGLILTEDVKAASMAQIEINNPSFERPMKRDPSNPLGWTNHKKCPGCEVIVEPGQYFVERSAAEGHAFIVLRADDKGLGNMLSQTLSQPMTQGGTYGFSVFLAKNEAYFSTKLKSSDTEWSNKSKYNGALVFYIWGYNDKSETMELLGSTGLIEHSEWKKYEFKLKPLHDDYNHIALEAWYNPKTKAFYKGHILVDNCSMLEKVE